MKVLFYKWGGEAPNEFHVFDLGWCHYDAGQGYHVEVWLTVLNWTFNFSFNLKGVMSSA